MKNTPFLISFTAALLLVAGAVAHAQTTNPFSAIQFPITELGGCTDTSSCKAYCDIAANQSACFTWGQAHGLIPKTAQPPQTTTVQLQKAIASSTGPGGCTSVDQCKLYCSDDLHGQECVSFAQSHGLLSKDQQVQVQKLNTIDQLLASSTGPGGCTSADQCKTYCTDPNNRDACVSFAQKAGLITPAQATQLSATSTMTGPGGCTSKDSCAAFCNDPDNQDACIQFSQDHGIISATQAQTVRQAVTLAPYIAQASSTVTQCITTALGTNAVTHLEDGTVPPPDQLAVVKNCFGDFKPSASSTPSRRPLPITATSTRPLPLPGQEHPPTTSPAIPAGAHPTPAFGTSTAPHPETAKPIPGTAAPAGSATSAPPPGTTPPAGSAAPSTVPGTLPSTSGNGQSFIDHAKNSVANVFTIIHSLVLGQ